MRQIKDITRIVLELPKNQHKAIKTNAAASGQTIKEYMLSCVYFATKFQEAQQHKTTKVQNDLLNTLESSGSKPKFDPIHFKGILNNTNKEMKEGLKELKDGWDERCQP